MKRLLVLIPLLAFAGVLYAQSQKPVPPQFAVQPIGPSGTAGATGVPGATGAAGPSGVPAPTMIATTGAAVPPAANCADSTVTMTGATTGMVCAMSPATSIPAGDAYTIASCYVSSAGTITIHICTVGAVTPATQTFNFRALP